MAAGGRPGRCGERVPPGAGRRRTGVRRPRVPLSRALFQLGRSAEAQALISELEAEGRRDPRLCDLVAEVLVERSDLPAALRWATAGWSSACGRRPTTPGVAARCRASGGRRDQSELRMLLSLRYRIRNDLGLPEDDYDRLLDEAPPARTLRQRTLRQRTLRPPAGAQLPHERIRCVVEIDEDQVAVRDGARKQAAAS